MKKEDLLKLDGMTDDLAAKVVEMSTEEMKGMIPKTRLDEVIAERDHAKADHADVLKQLGVLQKESKDVNVDGLKAKIAQLETDAKEAAKTHAAEINHLKIDNAVNTALIGAKALNTKAVKALLNLDKAELDEDGTVKGLADQIKALQTADDSKFMFGSVQIKGAKQGESGDSHEPGSMTLDNFHKMSPLDRHQFAMEHPEEYKELYES